MEFKRPQLCQVYKGTENIKGWYAEPKINGNRGLIFIQNNSVKAISRNNKPIYNTELIQEAILSSGLNQCVLDGEFYVPGDTTNNTDWSNTTSVLRTQTKHTEKAKLCFFAFDIMLNDGLPEAYFKKIDSAPLKFFMAPNLNAIYEYAFNLYGKGEKENIAVAPEDYESLLSRII